MYTRSNFHIFLEQNLRNETLESYTYDLRAAHIIKMEMDAVGFMWRANVTDFKINSTARKQDETIVWLIICHVMKQVRCRCKTTWHYRSREKS